MYEQIVQLISSVGFPIVACIFMYKQNSETLDKMNDTINSLKDELKELRKDISKAINKGGK